MSIRSVVTRGYGNGTFNGTISLVVVRGYAPASAEGAIGPGWVAGAWIQASWVTGAWGDAVAAITGNTIFGHAYNMIHTIHEAHLRPTTITELIVRKRDKKPIISGGDH